MIKTSKELVQWIQAASPQRADAFELGTIQSLVPLNVSFDGDMDDSGTPITMPVALARMNNYSPSIGDRVLLARVRNAWVVIDIVTTSVANTVKCGRQVTGNNPQDIPHAVWTTLAGYNATSYVKFPAHDFPYTLGVYTTPTGRSGLYRWEVTVAFPATTTAHRRLFRPLVNGVTLSPGIGSQEWDYSGPVTSLSLTTGGFVFLQDGDDIRISFYQNSGDILSATPTAYTLA